MSWKSESTFGSTRLNFFGNYKLTGNIFYRGLSEDAGCFYYYLNPVGWIIAQSFQPYQININGENAVTDFIGYNGYYRYQSSSYWLYFSYIANSFIVITKDNNNYNFVGCQPVSYEYTNEKNEKVKFGTNYYRKSDGILTLGSNTFNGFNNFANKSITVTVKQNFYKKNANTNQFVHTQNSKKKLFGIPAYNSSLGFKIYKCYDEKNTLVVFKSLDNTFQIKKVGSKFIYGTIDSENGWWEADVIQNRKSFTLKFKKPANSEATGKDIVCSYIGLQVLDLQTTPTYYGDLARWL